MTCRNAWQLFVIFSHDLQFQFSFKAYLFFIFLNLHFVGFLYVLVNLLFILFYWFLLDENSDFGVGNLTKLAP